VSDTDAGQLIATASAAAASSSEVLDLLSARVQEPAE